MSSFAALLKLPWDCQVVMMFFFFIILFQWIEWREQTQSAFLLLIYFLLQPIPVPRSISCWSNIFHDISILSILLAIIRVHIIWGEIASPPECPWIARMYAKDPWEVSQYSNLTLLHPLWICSIDSDDLNSSAPFSQNPLNNLSLNISQCTVRSVSRSSWSKWRSNLTPSSIFAMRENTRSTIAILELSATFFSEYQWFSSWTTLDSLWVEQDSVPFC